MISAIFWDNLKVPLYNNVQFHLFHYQSIQIQFYIDLTSEQMKASILGQGSRIK